MPIGHAIHGRSPKLAPIAISIHSRPVTPALRLRMQPTELLLQKGGLLLLVKGRCRRLMGSKGPISCCLAL